MDITLLSDTPKWPTAFTMKRCCKYCKMLPDALKKIMFCFHFFIILWYIFIYLYIYVSYMILQSLKMPYFIIVDEHFNVFLYCQYFGGHFLLHIFTVHVSGFQKDIFKQMLYSEYVLKMYLCVSDY